MKLRSTHMPYCIQRLDDGRYILLNRAYKPLGVQTSDWIDYNTHPSAAKLSITPALAAKLSWGGKTDTDRIFLYADGCIPTDSAVHMRAYLDRLALLLAVEVKVPG